VVGTKLVDLSGIQFLSGVQFEQKVLYRCLFSMQEGMFVRYTVSVYACLTGSRLIY
jgi:hypothetical protein